MPTRFCTWLFLCLLLSKISQCGSIPFDFVTETGRLDPQIVSTDDLTGVAAYIDDNKDGVRLATGPSEATQASESDSLTLFLIGILAIMLSMVGRHGRLRRKEYRGPPRISTRDAVTLHFQQPCCSQWVRKAARRWWQ